MTLKAPRRSRAAQAGFTLVEIAIVLVIIGLLLGGVLKGQELIENGRVKSAANDFNGILAAHNSYFDRYRRLPGDDGNTQPLLVARGGKWATINAASFGNVSGFVDEAPGATFAPVGEGGTYFVHLRAAGFINGDPTLAPAASLPTNPWGGLIGVTATTPAAPVQNRTTTNLLLCMGNVPGKAAQALDTQFDDGFPGSGALQATVAAGVNTPPGAAPAAAVPYTENSNYTICRDML